MSVGFDLLPAAYRDRIGKRRAHRELLAMAVPVVLALLATDHLLRQRVHSLRQMVVQARDHAARSQHLAAETRALTHRADELRAEIATATDQLAAPRMTTLLDGLLDGRPAGVRFQDLRCVHEPWAAGATPTIQLHATCATALDFTTYLTALRASDVLPPLACERSDIRPGSGEFGFQLQTDKDGPRSAEAVRR